MRIVKGFTLRSVAGEMIVSAEAIEQMNFNKLIALNESAAYLWSRVEDSEFSVQTLADLLYQEYEVEPQKASQDAQNIVNKWTEVGLVE